MSDRCPLGYLFFVCLNVQIDDDQRINGSSYFTVHTNGRNLFTFHSDMQF